MFDAGRLHKYVTTLDLCLLDAFYALHVDVENADSPRSTDVCNCFFAITTHKITVSIQTFTYSLSCVKLATCPNHPR